MAQRAGRLCAGGGAGFAANRLVWLLPAPADNSWVIAIPNALAREKRLKTLDDFAAFVRRGRAGEARRLG